MATLQPHQTRVVDEKAELDGRLRRLGDFLRSPTFETVGIEEASRLRKQHALMVQLSDVLGQRIDGFIQLAAVPRQGS